MQGNQNFKQSQEQSNFDFFHELSKDLWSHIHRKNDNENSIFSKFNTSLKEDSAFLEYLHRSLKNENRGAQNYVAKH